jgi:hypothetical protein
MIPHKLANKLLGAFFAIGGNRRWSQLGARPEREFRPRHVVRELQEQAQARRVIRQAKRLGWKCEFDATYYRAPQLPDYGAAFVKSWNGRLGAVLSQLEAI